MKIGPYVFVGARGKVHSHIESYAWVQKSWSFVKLHDIENFPIWVLFNLKGHLMTWDFFKSREMP